MVVDVAWYMHTRGGMRPRADLGIKPLLTKRSKIISLGGRENGHQIKNASPWQGAERIRAHGWIDEPGLLRGWQDC